MRHRIAAKIVGHDPGLITVMSSGFKMFVASLNSKVGKQLSAFPKYSVVYVVVDSRRGDAILSVIDPATWPELSKTVKFRTLAGVSVG